MGGGLALVGEPLRAAVAEALPGWIMEAFHPVPVLRLTALGEDAVPVGALLLAQRSLAETGQARIYEPRSEVDATPGARAQ